MDYENKKCVLNLPVILSLEENKRKIVLNLIEKLLNTHGSLGITTSEIIIDTLRVYSYLITKEEAQREEKIEKIVK